MGDEGIGVHVVRAIEAAGLPDGVHCLDGGVGSFLLLEPLQQAARVILVDATVDGRPEGALRRLTPRFSSEYPRTLTAHDIGLKDLLDTAYLTGDGLDVVLFAVSINPLQGISTVLSPVLAARLAEIVKIVTYELSPTPAICHACL